MRGNHDDREAQPGVPLHRGVDDINRGVRDLLGAGSPGPDHGVGQPDLKEIYGEQLDDVFEAWKAERLKEILKTLDDLHRQAIWTSAPYSRDGKNDDLCCATCDHLGDRHTYAIPHWPCETRVLLDELKEILS